LPTAHASGSSIFVEGDNVLAFCRGAASLNQAVGEIYASDAKLAQCLGDELRALHRQFLAPQQFLNNVLDLMLFETFRRTAAPKRVPR
jgi:hypothetical protein